MYASTKPRYGSAASYRCAGLDETIGRLVSKLCCTRPGERRRDPPRFCKMELKFENSRGKNEYHDAVSLSDTTEFV